MFWVSGDCAKAARTHAWMSAMCAQGIERIDALPFSPSAYKYLDD